MWISSCSFGDVRIYSADPDAMRGAGSVGISSPPDFKGFKHSSNSTFEVYEHVGEWEMHENHTCNFELLQSFPLYMLGLGISKLIL